MRAFDARDAIGHLPNLARYPLYKQ